MSTIQVDDEVRQSLAMMARTFEIPENDVIRRLLKLPPKTASVASPEPQPPPTKHPVGDAIQGMLSTPIYKSGDGKQKYFSILGLLYRSNPKKFEEFDQYSQRNRILIARDPKIIEKSGESTNPRKLEGTPFYLLTTLSNQAKRAILQAILLRFGISHDTIRLVLETIPDSPYGRGKKSLLDEYTL